jgi:hypothetical protein
MGGLMRTYGSISFLCTDDARANEISSYFRDTVAPAMELRDHYWYADDEEIGSDFRPIDDTQYPDTRMMIIFSKDHPTLELDLSPAAVLLNKQFQGIDAKHEFQGSEG